MADKDPLTFRLLDKYESLPAIYQVLIGISLGWAFWAVIGLLVWLIYVLV